MNQCKSLRVTRAGRLARNPLSILTLLHRLLCAAPAALLLAAAASVQGQNRITLAWDASPGSAVAGYRLYQGRASGTYTNVIAVGKVTTATVSNLVVGATYYFAVTAYDTNNLESAYSMPISYAVTNPPPAISIAGPVNGSSFAAGATVALSAAVSANGHTISQVTFYNGANKLGSDSTSPFSLTWSNISAGTYSVSAAVTYDTGNTLSSTPVMITVTASTPALGLTINADAGTITSPFVVSGGQVYQAVDSGVADGGRAAYTFNVASAGNYTVLAQVLAASDGANSLFVNIDAEPTDPLMIWDTPVASTLTSRTVTWRGNGTFDPATAQYSPKVFALSAGKHTLIVRGREAYTRLGAITIAAVPPRVRIRRGSSGSALLPQSPDAVITLEAAGNPGDSYDVYRSPDLKSWTKIGTLTLDATGAGSFTDSVASTQPSSYYRLQGR